MKTNRTNFQHAAYGLAMQTAITAVFSVPAFFFGAPWLPMVGMWCGAFFATGWFGGREHAQKEVDIVRTTKRRIEDLSPWEGLQWKGDDDRVADATFPAVATFGVAALTTIAVLIYLAFTLVKALPH